MIIKALILIYLEDYNCLVNWSKVADQRDQRISCEDNFINENRTEKCKTKYLLHKVELFSDR